MFQCTNIEMTEETQESFGESSLYIFHYINMLLTVRRANLSATLYYWSNTCLI